MKSIFEDKRPQKLDVGAAAGKYIDNRIQDVKNILFSVDSFYINPYVNKYWFGPDCGKYQILIQTNTKYDSN